MSDLAHAWTFLTNHAHVLLCLVRERDIRQCDIAERVGITERAVQKIVTQLEAAGYITRKRNGRRNTYQVHIRQPLRRPIARHRCVEDLLELS